MESVLENVGASERTVDEEFEMHHKKFLSMMCDMNECKCFSLYSVHPFTHSRQLMSYGLGGAANSSALNLQKSYFGDATELSNIIARIHENYCDNGYWTGVTPQLTSLLAAEKYKEVMNELHNVFRSSSAIVALEKGIDPFREAIKQLSPAIDKKAKERNTQLMDYDSYRRRLAGLREKKESLESQGKGGSKAGQENAADIAKFEGKENTAKELYEQKNEALKNDIIEARAQHDHLMNDLLVSVVVAQAELFRAAAAKLEEVIELLPQDKVEEVRAEIAKVVGQGGVLPVKDEKTSLQKGVMIFTGKAVPSDFKKQDGDQTTPTAQAVPVPRTDSFNAKNPFEATGDAFSVDNSRNGSSAFVSKSSATVPPPPPPVVPTPKKVTVVALYDLEAEADDELSFKAGDIVEVLESGDDGWWKGRCNGQVGLFPVNYVDATPR